MMSVLLSEFRSVCSFLGTEVSHIPRGDKIREAATKRQQLAREIFSRYDKRREDWDAAGEPNAAEAVNVRCRTRTQSTARRECSTSIGTNCVLR